MTGPNTENIQGMPGPIEDRTSPFEPEPQAKMPNKPDALTWAPCQICGSNWQVQYDKESKRCLCGEHRIPLKLTELVDALGKDDKPGTVPYVDPSRDKLYTIAVPNVASDTQHRIAQECINIARYLLEKNQQYGSSMMMPGALFSKSTPLERVDVMVDTTLGQIGDEKLVQKKRSLIQKLIGWLVIRQLATDDQMENSNDI